MEQSEKAIRKTLLLDKHGKQRPRWQLWSGGVVALLLIVVVFNLLFSSNNGAVSYKTTEVKRGDLLLNVTATGTLQPVSQVDVGSELSGTLASVEVDFNDTVEKDQVLATLDTTSLENRIAEGKASLLQAEAKVQDARATEQEMKVKAKRCKELAKSRMCSPNDVDAAVAALARAVAAVSSSRAQVALAKATLEGYETNLQKATIRSPIKGIVLDRKVEPGQTVAASLQTPVLFTLAEDLTKMELVVAIDEADIGRIRNGMKAQFTVDAYPDKHFVATITQIRHAPQTVDGVVTYETVLAVDNPEQLLLPGMTATADIQTRHLENVLLVSNAVFRYSPPVTTKASKSGGSIFSRLFRRPGMPRGGNGKKVGDENRHERKVWLLRDGKPEELTINIGASDGIMTEVTSGALEPGMALITDSVAKGQ
jgi:HlyD family secretion protein